MKTLYTALRLLIATGMVLSIQNPLRADIVLLNFEGFPGGIFLTTQYSGVTFANATVVSAGISLNEFEFPPHSGDNVVFDDGGPISISFATPVLSFGGDFTYLDPLTLAAFDATSSEVALATSDFSANDALFGDPGSSPNEFLQVSFPSGISSITITGDPAGDSFVMDDVTYTTPSSVPEPGSVFLLLTAAIGALAFRRLFDHMNRAIISIFIIAVAFAVGSLWVYGEPQAGEQSRQSVPALAITPSVGIPSAAPSAIPVATATTVTVTVSIVPAPILNSINLLRLGTTGTQPTILGVMRDDGQNGDPVAGDGIYTLKVQFNEPIAGQIQLQASAAFQGQLKRVLSPIVTINVWDSFSNAPLGISFLIPPTMVVSPLTDPAAISIYVHNLNEELPSGGLTITRSSQSLAATLERISRTLNLIMQTTSTFNGYSWTLNTYSDPTSGQQFIDAFTIVDGTVYQVGGMNNPSITNTLSTVLGTSKFM